MIKCFYDTKSYGTEICFVVSPDDPALEEYKVNLSEEELIIYKDRYTPAKTNYVATVLHPGLAYYGVIDDDQYCRTRGWDAAFMAEIERHGGWGLCCGEDKLTKDWYICRHPAGYILASNFIKEFGYMVNPIFRHVGIDNWFACLFGGAGCLYYLPDVIIEHMHANVGKAPMDDQYRWIYGEEMDHGMKVFNQWFINRQVDINKLEDAIKGGVLNV
jgi:hypothetical protein